MFLATFGDSAAAQTIDPDTRFVEVMRSRGDFDLAIEFLEDAKAGGFVTQGLRGRIEYELAVTRLEQAGRLRRAESRDEAVAAAQRDLEKFVQSSNDPLLVAEGRARLAGALSSQGYRLVASAKRTGTERNRAGSSRQLQDARKAYDSARELYTQAAAAYEAALDDPAVKPGGARAAERPGLVREQARMQVMAARTLQDKGATYAEGSKAAKKLYTDAASQLLDLYDRYVDEPIGMYAHLWEGQCYQAIGRHRLAKGCFEELVIQDASLPVFRVIITLAHAYLAKSRLAEDETQKALDDGSRWLAELKPGEAQAAAAALRYQLGDAAFRLAANAKAGDKTRLLNRARSLFRESSQQPGDFQRDARLKLAEVSKALGASAEPPANFKEAYQRGQDALTAMQSANLSARVAASNNPGSAEQLEQSVDRHKQDAFDAFQVALRLVDDETEAAQLNEVRYKLAYLYLDREDYLRAAALSEFIATAYPEDLNAEQAVRLALVALKQLYIKSLAGEGDPADASGFERDQLRSVAEYASRQWQGEAVADAAFSDLMSIAIRSGDLVDARRVLGQAPADRRPALSLKLASALWEQGSRAAATAGDDAAARRAALATKSNARQMLAESLPAVRGRTPVTVEVATGGLYLALAELEAGDAAAAVKLLEDKEIGALKLVASKAAAANRRGFAAEAYKAALRAYVAVSPPRPDDAIKMMNKLEAAVGGDPASLNRVYINLGLQLQRQIDGLSAAGNRRSAERLVGAFAVFLDRLSQRLADADWVTQQWVGRTYASLGDGLQEGSDAAAREQYYGKAAGVFRAMIDRAAAESGFAPTPGAVTSARLQLGRAQRGAGQYQQAIDTFTSVLVTRPTLLDVQKAAATTYQAWGASGESDRLMTAIIGARLDPKTNKNLIWGWTKLAKVAATAARRQPKYKDLFFECWLNVATCRYLAAEQASGAEREKQLASARRTLKSMVRGHPDLGGPERRATFDRLLRDIQRLEGAEVTGLKELGA